MIRAEFVAHIGKRIARRMVQGVPRLGDRVVLQIDGMIVVGNVFGVSWCFDELPAPRVVVTIVLDHTTGYDSLGTLPPDAPYRGAGT